MGCTNQLEWVRRHRDLLAGPVLEVGSLRCRHSQDYRSLGPNLAWYGLDQEAGPGVDVVVDLADPEAWYASGWPKAPNGSRQGYGTILLLSVLEHCRAPWRMAETLSYSLLPGGGVMFVSVPFAWRWHPEYGGDYWRCTPDGVRELFPLLDWDTHPGCLCTATPGDYRERDDLPDIIEGGHLLPTLVNMIGVMA